MAAIIFEQHTNPFLMITNPSSDVKELADAATQILPGIIEAGVPRNVQTDQPVEIEFQWTQVGFLTQFNLSAFVDFRLEFYMEEMGTGESVPLFSKTVNYTTGVGHTYNEKIPIPANTIPAGNYKCVAVFKLGLGTDTPFAGFAEFPLVNFFVSNV